MLSVCWMLSIKVKETYFFTLEHNAHFPVNVLIPHSWTLTGTSLPLHVLLRLHSYDYPRGNLLWLSLPGETQEIISPSYLGDILEDPSTTSWDSYDMIGLILVHTCVVRLTLSTLFLCSKMTMVLTKCWRSERVNGLVLPNRLHSGKPNR